jgi:hypothetical protein
MTTTNNARPQRQTLASQIDRLEKILAGLTGTLGQTIAEAVQDAVGKAVELTVREVLTNPEVLSALRNATPATEPAKAAEGSSLGQAWQRTSATVREQAAWAGAQVKAKAAKGWSWLGSMCAWIGGGLQTAWTALGTGCGRVFGFLTGLCQVVPALLLMLWACRKPLLIALGVGLLLGMACYLAGPLVSSTVSGLAGFVGTLAVDLFSRFRRMLGVIQEPVDWVN